MKNAYLILLFTLFFGCLSAVPQGFSQQSDRVVLIEQFSNTRCGICANRVPTFWETVSGFGDEVLLISLYSPAPYPNCELYQASRSLNDERVSFYNIPGSPTLHINGERAPGNIWQNAQSYLNSLAGSLSPVDINVGMEIQGSNGEAVVQITQSSVLPGSEDLVLRAFVVEKNVTAGTLQSYQDHHNVARFQLSPSSGSPIDGLAGITQEFSFNFAIDGDWDADELAIIAFVQGVSSSEVYNAGIGESILSNTFSRTPAIESLLELYPNPAQDQVNIRTSVKGIKSVQIFNILGSLVYSQDFSDHTKTINTAAFRKGMYLVRLESEGRSLRTIRLLIE